MNIIIVFIGFVIGLIIGRITLMWIRKMFAPIFFRRHLCIGNILQARAHLGCDFYFYIPVESRANTLWNLVISSIHNVRATISFIDSKKGNRVIHHTYWLPRKYFIELQIDDKGNRVKVDKPVGDQHIELELYSGHASLGKWLFKNAIVDGVTQEVSPIKL